MRDTVITYTNARNSLVVKLVYSQEVETRSEALKREAGVKKLIRAEKLDLVRSFGFFHKVETSGRFLA
ncbi:hypothetical protein D4R78_05355 [bacterium]|nr:MAG: hypothetical protein D4R78_05355 [bacterium]